MEPITDLPRNDQSIEASRTRFELRRSRSVRMLSGVCGGVAKAFNIDVNLVRLGVVALSVISGGAGVVLYAAAWILIPEEDGERSLAQDWTQIVTDKIEQNKN